MASTRDAPNLQHLPVLPVQEVKNHHFPPWGQCKKKKASSSFSLVTCSHCFSGPQNDPASFNWTPIHPPSPPSPAELRATCVLQMNSLATGVPKPAPSSHLALAVSELLNHLAQSLKESTSLYPLEVIGCNLLE